MSLRMNVRNFLLGATLAEMLKELEISIERGDTERAGYIKELICEDYGDDAIGDDGDDGDDGDNSTIVKVCIEQDDCVENPREWWNIGRMVCWHRRYNIGDPHKYDDSDDFMEQLACEVSSDIADRLEYIKNELYNTLSDCAYYDAEMTYTEAHDYAIGKVNKLWRELIEKTVNDNYVILPVYMYDHSGVAYSTGSFGCPWDSGQVGYIYCTMTDVEKEFGGSIERAEKALSCEVEAYSDWASGSVYFARLVNAAGEDVDNCGGFYGSDWDKNGLREYVAENCHNGEDIDDLMATIGW